MRPQLLLDSLDGEILDLREPREELERQQVLLLSELRGSLLSQVSELRFALVANQEAGLDAIRFH